MCRQQGLGIDVIALLRHKYYVLPGVYVMRLLGIDLMVSPRPRCYVAFSCSIDSIRRLRHTCTHADWTIPQQTMSPAPPRNHAVRCSAVQCGAVQCGAVRCSAVQCGDYSFCS